MNIPTLSPALEYDIISSIINTVGRNITLTYVSSRDVCSTCGGNDPFCPTCSGNGTVDTLATKVVKANILWRGGDSKIYKPEGQFVEGDCRVDFVVDSVGAYETTDSLLKQVTKILVDNRSCVIDRWYFEGSPINRVSLVLNQDSNVGGQRVG